MNAELRTELEELHSHAGVSLFQDPVPLAMSESSSSSSEGAAAGQLGVMIGGDYPESFRVTTDLTSGTHSILSAYVSCPDGTIITPTGIGQVSGDVFCRVKVDSKSGKWSAEISNDSTADDSTRAVVKIASVDSDGVKQYHVGTIVIGNSANIETKAGFTINKDKKLDLVDRGEKDEFKVHKIIQVTTGSDGKKTKTTLGKFLSTFDLELEYGGGDDGTVDAITGIEFSLESQTLKYKLTKTPVYKAGNGKADESYTDIMVGENMDVVTSVDFSAQNKALTKTVQKSVLIFTDSSSAGGAAETENIVEVVEHSSNS